MHLGEFHILRHFLVSSAIAIVPVLTFFGPTVKKVLSE
jgi:hypothetical protein